MQDDPAAAERLRAGDRGVGVGAGEHERALRRRQDQPTLPRALPLRDRPHRVRREGPAARDRLRHPQHSRHPRGPFHPRHGLRRDREGPDRPPQGAVSQVRGPRRPGAVERGPHLRLQGEWRRGGARLAPMALAVASGEAREPIGPRLIAAPSPADVALPAPSGGDREDNHQPHTRAGAVLQGEHPPHE